MHSVLRASAQTTVKLGVTMGLLLGMFSVTSHAGSSMRDGAQTSQPAGHYVYCRTNRHHCGNHRDAGPAAFTNARWAAMESVNQRVNRAIRPATDQQIFGKAEVWKVGGRAGDCEDYALKKRSMLMSKGFHPSQLPLIKVRRRNGEAHIVLGVRTTKGDFVLDNLSSSIKPWRSTGYRFLKKQSTGNDNIWVSIRG